MPATTRRYLFRLDNYLTTDILVKTRYSCRNDETAKSDPDDYPRFDPGRGSGLHWPWPAVYRHVVGIVPSGERWPSLPWWWWGVVGFRGPQSCRGQGAHAPRGRQDGTRTHRVATSPASRCPSSRAHPMAGSAPRDPAGFVAVALGDVALTGTVQERDRWSQILNECGVGTQEPSPIHARAGWVQWGIMGPNDVWSLTVECLTPRIFPSRP
jgi:hypothetical protein